MIQSWQIKQIHILKNQLGLDDDIYHEMLSSFDVWTSKNLTETEANIFISILKDKLRYAQKNYHKKYEDLKNRDSKMASPSQLRKMEAVWRDICTNKNENIRKHTLRAYLKNKFHIDDIRFITKEKAQKIIAVMEKKILESYKFLKAF